MNNKCINLKQKLDRTLYCKEKKKIIKISECNNCKYKDILYKNKDVKIKKRTSKLNKLERNRFSILTNDLDHCIICGKEKDNLHEVFAGRNRLNSIKYGCVIPLCALHHIKIHNDIELDTFYKKMAQKRFMIYYNEDKKYFIGIFRKNYI